MPNLKEFHNHNGGINWKLTEEGVFVEGSGIERTEGKPLTVTRIWENFGPFINDWASHYNVYCELIIATIGTESGGNPNALRKEPKYVSDEETPNQISPGLMQTLISTARETLADNSIDRDWLLIPRNSIQAGTSYINQQKTKTMLDPPKVACAYNSGGVYDQDGTDNRWKMRQYPIGTGEHCSRFVKWINDAVFMLENHQLKPSLSLKDFLNSN